MVLAVLIAVWAVSQRPPARLGDVPPPFAPGAGPTDEGLVAADLAAPGDAAPLADEVRAAGRVEAPAEDDAAKTARRDRQEGPESPDAPVIARPEPTPNPIFTLIVSVRGTRFQGSGTEADVTARMAGADGFVMTGRAPLRSEARLEHELQVGRMTSGDCTVLVTHPDFAPWQGTIDLSRRTRLVGTDRDGHVRLEARVSVTLERHVALVRGHAIDCDQVALAPYSTVRDPGPLPIVDVWRGSGMYELRVPKAGEWVVIALREGAHPTYAVVDVPALAGASFADALEVIAVDERLQPGDTRLRIESNHPVGYDPSGIEVKLVPVDPRGNLYGRSKVQGGYGGGPPRITWHRTTSTPIFRDVWGYDLRRLEPVAERGDAIEWLESIATLRADGGVELTGGPTGQVCLLVENPFLPGSWEANELAQIGPSDIQTVVPPVARLDVRALGPGGPLAGGKVEVGGIVEPRAAGDLELGDSGARTVPARSFELSQTLVDPLGVSVFVPSDTRLDVWVRDATGTNKSHQSVPSLAPGTSRVVSFLVESSTPVDEGVAREGGAR